MRTLRSFARLSGERRKLLLEALWLVVLVRVALWTLPFARVRRLADRLARTRPAARAATREEAALIAWAVRQASRRVPGASCLTQALAARVLLGRQGLASQLAIGIARGTFRELSAHAWLESGDWLVVGGATAGRYTPLHLSQEAPR